MNRIPAPIVRIIIRWLVGMAAGIGVVGPVGAEMIADNLTSSPEVIDWLQVGIMTAITFGVGLANELWYRAAKRFGWET